MTYLFVGGRCDGQYIETDGRPSVETYKLVSYTLDDGRKMEIYRLATLTDEETIELLIQGIVR